MDTTSIDTLPTNQQQTSGQVVQPQATPVSPNQYNPNITPPASAPPTLTKDMINEVTSSIQQVGRDGSTTLPSRDIPRDTLHLTTDAQVNADHIPVEDKMRDYIGDYDDTQAVIQQHVKESQEKDRLEQIYQEIQNPVLIMLLYFLYQLPIVNATLHKLIPKLFNKDGNLSIGGLFIKTFAFGVSFYSIIKSIHMIQ